MKVIFYPPLQPIHLLQSVTFIVLNDLNKMTINCRKRRVDLIANNSSLNDGQHQHAAHTCKLAALDQHPGSEGSTNVVGEISQRQLHAVF
jgi:hypothetical protein